jgi:hypothetical protein
LRQFLRKASTEGNLHGQEAKGWVEQVYSTSSRGIKGVKRTIMYGKSWAMMDGTGIVYCKSESSMTIQTKLLTFE